MPARSLCQKYFRDALAPLHVYRQKVLVDATSAVVNGASRCRKHAISDDGVTSLAVWTCRKLSL